MRRFFSTFYFLLGSGVEIGKDVGCLDDLLDDLFALFVDFLKVLSHGRVLGVRFGERGENAILRVEILTNQVDDVVVFLQFLREEFLEQKRRVLRSV